MPPINENLLYLNEKWINVSFSDEASHATYEISNRGRIKSYAGDGEGKIIAGSVINGYRVVMVRLSNGKTKTKYVHRLIAEYFLSPRKESDKFVIHLDHNKENNHINNLKWVDKEELRKHMNTNPNVKASRSKGYKLKETDVKVIKKLLQSNKTRLSMIAKRFGITHTQLNRIRKGENWGHVSA
ncbi:MAG: NUMOD4 motif-containing HNH endonuclease [Cyclobacteriaceae bacterium]|nr:HNH endonuclease [Cyclobacteriaceae bacterium]MCH8516371.1 NUMOD4 motif-containing HNH endonuclease [Cyclobacteriaceae bacterium]